MADLNEVTKMTDHTSEFDPNDIQNNKTMGILAYISFLVLVPIFSAKDSKWARFHANQGLVLLIAEGVAAILSFLGIIPYVGWLFSIPGWILYVVCVVFSVLGIVNAAKGQAKDLPLISKIKILK